PFAQPGTPVVRIELYCLSEMLSGARQIPLLPGDLAETGLTVGELAALLVEPLPPLPIARAEIGIRQDHRELGFERRPVRQLADHLLVAAEMHLRPQDSCAHSIVAHTQIERPLELLQRARIVAELQVSLPEQQS